MPATLFITSQSCAPAGGVLVFEAGTTGGQGVPGFVEWTLGGPAGSYPDSGQFGSSSRNGFSHEFTVSDLPDGQYALVATNEEGDTQTALFTVACTPAGGGLRLDSLTSTAETAAGNDGTATIQASGGVPPLTASVVGGASQPATSGQPITFTGLAPGTYTVRVTDDTQPVGIVVEGTVTIAAYVAPAIGCTDAYADNYDPDATADSTPTSCTFTPRWRSAWGPGQVPVRVPALPGQTLAYTTAELFIGFRLGHPLGDVQPLGEPLVLTATVGPDGFATFRLGPYLQPALGAADGNGGRRLDLNSPTATTDDLYVGYELRRTTGELLEHGYALNAAVPDATLTQGAVLSPWVRQPEWPGYIYKAARLSSSSASRYGSIEEIIDDGQVLPCPQNPLPVAWLNPQGGFSFWVFQGRPQLGDEVGEGSTYQEPETGERRYADRGAGRRTITASSGIFKGADLMEGLRTLWRSPQVWYRPVADGPWVAVTLESGSFPAGRLGVAKQQVSISLTHAAPEWAQGQ